jgi:hypothetical protein
MKTLNKITKNNIGCIIDSSSWSADYLNSKTVEFAHDLGFEIDDGARKLLARYDCEVMKDDDGQTLSELSDEALDFLNGLELPDYCHFHFDDNSLFLTPDLETARQDCEFISSRTQDSPDDDFSGQWLHVSDHGNATLYFRDDKGNDREIWRIV